MYGQRSSHTAATNVRQYVTGARYALSSESPSAQEILSMHQGRLSDAQVVMIRNCEFRGEYVVSHSQRWSVEVDTRQREFEARGRHWNEEIWGEKVEPRLGGSTVQNFQL